MDEPEKSSLDDVFGRMTEQRKKREQKREYVPKRMSDAERDRFHRENLTRPPQNWNKPFPFKWKGSFGIPINVGSKRCKRMLRAYKKAGYTKQQIATLMALRPMKHR